MRRFVLAATLTASALLWLAAEASANTDDRGGLVLPLAVQLAQARAEVASLTQQVADVTAQRDDARAQLEQRTAERDKLQQRVDALTSGRGGGGGSAVVTLGTVGNATQPNRFTAGQCTWYAASRRYVPWMGDAWQWWGNAAAMGFPEGQVPEPGAIMVTRESGWGHVAIVESVSGTSWTVSEMNFVAAFVVSTRTLLPGQTSVVGFIYG